MEILFRNKRNTAKLCMMCKGESVLRLEDYELDSVKEILSFNEGYKWEPVKTGFAYDNNLPLIGAGMRA